MVKVLVYYLLAYLKPTVDSASHSDFITLITYSSIPPMLNPLIYSLRNKDMIVAFSRLFGQKFFFFF